LLGLDLEASHLFAVVVEGKHVRAYVHLGDGGVAAAEQ
jgi:hypothetical protein